MSNHDTAQETAYDAIASKASAWKKGYFKDDMIQHVAKAHINIKEPMINRGSWFRVTLIQRVVQSFLDHYKNGQVIVLGGGLDTLYYRLNFEEKQTYYEIDLPEICQIKAQRLNLQRKESSFMFKNFTLIQLDLEDIHLIEKLGELGIDYKLPSCIVSDVVLSYLESDFTISLFDQLQLFTADLYSILLFRNRSY